MTLNETLMIVSTLAGPVLAVQAQKWLERARAKSGRREWIFDTLMATRGNRLGLDHVRALNAIDLAFSERNGGSKKTSAVVKAWHTYHAHLTKGADWNDPAKSAAWVGSGEELFINLLEAMAKATGHEFTRDQLKTGGYSPMGHGQAELEGQAVRRGALNVLSGMHPLRVEVIDPQHVTVQQVAQGAPLPAAGSPQRQA